MPFQERGAEWLAGLNQALLCWDAGTGKTPPTVVATEIIEARRILVIAPPIAVGVWRQHFEDWSHWKPRDIRVFNHKSALDPDRFIYEPGVCIVPYSRLRPDSSLNDAAKLNPFDVCIMDELHYAKNPRARRTKGAYGRRTDRIGGLIEYCPRVWGLSGTPILNAAHEFWSHLRALRPDLIRMQGSVLTEAQFIDHFCQTRQTPYGVQITGSRNTSELAQRIKPFVDRLRLKDALVDMPALRIVEHVLPEDTGIDPLLRREIKEAVAALGVDEEALDDEELLREVQAGSVAFSTARRLIGRAKIAATAQMVNDLLDDSEATEKIIVFCHHREVIAGLETALASRKPLVIVGSTALAARDTAIKAFQTDPKRRVILLSLDAASESITLTSARHVFLVEPSPVPARNVQAIGRAYRKGQTRPVLAQFVILPGTLDERITSLIARKTKDISRIVEGVGTVTLLDTPSTGPQRAAI
jgi:SWI/SNF-related matrix-associated actin-dependent regulator 1 of chromatin subfamily A